MSQVEKFDWFRFWFRRIKSSERWRQMKDFQRGWYITILIACADANPPGYVKFDERLWVLAGAHSRPMWDNHKGEVMACFKTRQLDGQTYLYNERLAGEVEWSLSRLRRSNDPRESGSIEVTEDGQILSKSDKRKEMRKKTQKLLLSISDLVLLEIYKQYPRRTKKLYAVECIRKAIASYGALENISHEEAADRILIKVKLYAASPAGNAGKYTLHCSTWMNQGEYLTDLEEWNRSDGSQSKEARKRPPDVRLYAATERIIPEESETCVDCLATDIRLCARHAAAVVDRRVRAAAAGSDD